MGLLKGAIKAGIVVKVADVVRREAAKPENQRKARELVDRIRREASKPENQRKARDVVDRVRSEVAKPENQRKAKQVLEKLGPRNGNSSRAH